MAMTSQDRLTELQRMVKWAQENRDTWDMAGYIISGDLEIEEDEYERVLTELLKEEFYSVLFLMFSASDSKMETAVLEAYKDLFISRIDEYAIRDFVQKVLQNLREEIACRC